MHTSDGLLAVKADGEEEGRGRFGRRVGRQEEEVGRRRRGEQEGGLGNFQPPPPS